MKKIVFYKVDNTCDYDRHSFDNCEEWSEVIEMLYKLYDDEYRIYDMSSGVDAQFFVEEFNDEIIDGGSWWCYCFYNS